MSETKINYMREIEMDLKEMMVGVPQEKQIAITTYVKEKVLTSFRNGQSMPKRQTKGGGQKVSN